MEKVKTPGGSPGVVWVHREVLGVDPEDGREWLQEFVIWEDDQGLLHFEVEDEHKDGYPGERYELPLRDFLNRLVEAVRAAEYVK